MSSSYKRILLKLSGEALSGETGFGVDPGALASIAGSVASAYNMGVRIGLVVGGGNIHRGAQTNICSNRVTSDHMGMLATVINSLAIHEALNGMGVECRVMSALEIPRVAETYVRARAMKHLESGRVMIFAGGTGNPYFTTDTTAALRALEIDAEVVIKATKVNGVYDKDPEKFDDAVLFSELDYDEVLARDLKVMDATAISLCRDNNLEIRVINIYEPENLTRLLEGEDVGSRVMCRRND